MNGESFAAIAAAMYVMREKIRILESNGSIDATQQRVPATDPGFFGN